MNNFSLAIPSYWVSFIRKLCFRIYKRQFVRNVAVVVSGTAMAQAITMACAPFITRLYGPEAFGILGTFMAIMTVILPVAALTYPIAIVLPKQDQEAVGLYRISSYIAIAMALLAICILAVFGHSLTNLLQIQSIKPFIWLIPLGILFGAWRQMNQQSLIRKKRFKITAQVAVLHAALINLSKICIGLFAPLAGVLIVIYALGIGLNAGMMFLGLRKTSFQQAYRHHKKMPPTQMWELAQKHYDFPLYRAPQVLLNAISQSLPILMLATFFGPASAGFYALGKRLLELPSQLIGNSVGSVFYPRVTAAVHTNENITRLIMKATLGLAGIGLVPFALVIAFGPWLFGYIFGSEWVTAGEYARWIAMWSFFGFINKPSMVSFPILNLQGFALAFEIFSFPLKVAALTIGFYFFENDILSIALFSITGILVNIIAISVCLYKSTYFHISAK